MDTWNVEDVILPQGKIRGSTVHDRPDIYGNNFTRQIFTLPIEDGTDSGKRHRSGPEPH